jgi:hypothetical protein
LLACYYSGVAYGAYLAAGFRRTVRALKCARSAREVLFLVPGISARSYAFPGFQLYFLDKF